MKRRYAAAALCAAVLLGGCATQRLPAMAEGENIAGRLAMRVDAVGTEAARSFSANFDLVGNAQQGAFSLSTPLGSQVAQARWEPGFAELTTSDRIARYPDLDALAQQMLGEPVPMAALIEWLRGRPWTGAPSTPEADGRGFGQLGWSVDVGRYEEGVLTARRGAPPAIDVRVRLDR